MKNLFFLIKEFINLIKESLVYLYVSLKVTCLNIFFFFKKIFVKKSNPKIDVRKIVIQRELEKYSYLKDIMDNHEKLRKQQAQFSFKRAFFSFFIYSSILMAAIITYFLWDLPDSRILKEYKAPLTTRVYSADAVLFKEFAVQKRHQIDIDLIPDLLKQSFISAEDKNFYSHFGFDIMGLGRAFINNIAYYFGKSNNLEGASTISQQVAKNFFLNSDRSLKRKIREFVLSIRMESFYTKDRILELYLNEIYLGRGSYGVSVASLNYFNKPLTDLTLEEMAFLAAIPKAPAKYDPLYNYDSAKERRDWVLNRMYDNGYITQEQLEKSLQTTIDVVDNNKIQNGYYLYPAEYIRKELVSIFSSNKVLNDGLIVKTTIDSTIQQEAYKALRKGIINYDQALGYRGPLMRLEISQKQLLADDAGNAFWYNLISRNEFVRNTKFKVAPWRIAIVIALQNDKMEVGLLDKNTVSVPFDAKMWAASINKEGTTETIEGFEDILQVGDVILVEEIDKLWVLRQIPEVNGAIVAMNTQNGEILAMQGGFSFLLNEFDRVNQAKRQPGSLLKPFVYLSALDNGYKVNDLVLDAPIVINDENTSWRPRNSGDIYRGYVTLRNALEHSRNLGSIRLADTIGLPVISENLINLGIYDSPLDNYAEVIGSRETTLIKLVNAFSVLANGGKAINNSIIRQVQANNGETIFTNETRSCKDCHDISWNNQAPPILMDTRNQILDEVNVSIIVNIMQGVVQRGTARRANLSEYSIAGKTGTTNDIKDVWFVGFTPDLAVGIYIGYDNPRTLEGASSSAFSVPVVADLFRNVLPNRDALPFKVSENTTQSWINYYTGEPSDLDSQDVILEMFRKGQNINPVIVDKRFDSDSQLNLEQESSVTTLSEEGIY